MRNPFPSRYECIFFDFDGVIVDSVEAKIKAFGALYAEFGDDVRTAVMDYQRAVPGETRFDKIPRFHRDLLGISLTPKQVSKWCNRLSAIVLDQVVACPLLPDVARVLAALHAREVAAHIVSGTPEDELHVIVERKGLRPWFASARGAPLKKDVIVREIMARNGIAPRACLFVGDAMTDYDCAQATGIDFLGRADPGCDPFPAGTAVVERLSQPMPLSAVSIAARRAA